MQEPKNPRPDLHVERTSSQQQLLLQPQLLEAAFEGDLTTLKDLEGKVDYSRGDYDNRTALHLASTAGNLEIVKFLLAHKVDPTAVDRWGGTALSYAIKNENFDIVKLLQQTAEQETKLSLWNSENDPVHIVLVHNFNDVRKAGSSVSSTLYGEVETNEEKEEYNHFFATLKQHNVSSLNIRDAILINSSKEELQEFTLKQLILKNEDESITWDEMEEFKKTVVSGMSYEQLGYALTHKFTFKVKRSPDGKLFTHTYETEPVLDLLERRFQVITPKGVVLVGDEKHGHSVNILEFCFKKLGLPIILRLPHPLHLSGIDYVLASPELSFIGTGCLTNEAAARYMLNKDVFGTHRVSVVRDIFDRRPERCLDRILKVISTNCVLLSGVVVGRNNPYRRLVTEYVRVGRKQYEVVRADVELQEYLESIGYDVIVVPPEIYESHNTEVFNFGQGELLVRSNHLADIITSNPNFKGKVSVLKTNLTSSNFVEKSYMLFRKPGSEYLPLTPLPKEKCLVWESDPSPESMQAARAVLMVAPVGFQTNTETAADNYFMKKVQDSTDEVEHKALLEFSKMHMLLTNHGIQVVLFCSERFHQTPDAVFPNNWFTTHPKSEQKEPTVVFYPMKTPSRRAERRQYIVSQLQSIYRREISFTPWEMEDFPHFLEGTGVLVLDRVRHVAYAALSKRCYSKIAGTWAERMGYKMCLFRATDAQRRPIYHTNVMMSVGTTVAIVCMESIDNEGERARLRESLESSGHEIVAITRDQMNQFCGNVLEVRAKTDKRHFLAMSARARAAFTDEQKATILKHVDDIISPDIDIIETIGGGGVRCMLGELF